MSKNMEFFLCYFIVLMLVIPIVGHPDVRTTVLCSAIKYGDLVQIAKLIESGVDINARNPEGLTPLMVAAQSGSIEVVELLLAKGADVAARIASYSITASTLASARIDGAEIVALLRKAEQGKTPGLGRQVGRSISMKVDGLFSGSASLK